MVVGCLTVGNAHVVANDLLTNCALMSLRRYVCLAFAISQWSGPVRGFQCEWLSF